MIIKDNMANMCAKVTSTYMEFTLAFGSKPEFSFSFNFLSVLMLGFIYTFKAFDLMFVMTSGGPLNATDVLGTYSYTLSFKQYEFSLGSATAMVLFCCLFVIGLFYLRLISKEDE